MATTDIAALLLGLGIALAVAVMAAAIPHSTDESMRWEGGVAVGFSALIVLGPFWIAQAVCTVLSTIDDGGISPWWLWAWLLLAPSLGMSPPAISLMKRVKPLRRKSSDQVLGPGARMQFLSDQAWADTVAEPGWVLRRTPPLPEAWPPPIGGSATWFCYAERADSPGVIEVAAPWGRIELAAGATEPRVHRLSNRVESLGPQAVKPIPPEQLTASNFSRLDAVTRGDAAALAGPLQQWRALHPRVAGHPEVAGRLPATDRSNE